MRRLYTLPLLAALGLLLPACETPDSVDMNRPIYQNEAFAVYPDRVEQGEYTATVHSPTHMSSNYQSPANAVFNRTFEFKFSLNGKDNELAVGVNHKITLFPGEGGSITSEPITFGEVVDRSQAVDPGDYLEANTQWTVQVNLAPVLEAFKAQGYYENYAGDRLAESDFRGVFIAGNAAPMSWDFENLPSRPQFALNDEDGDGIYSATITLNAYDADNFTAQEWKLAKDLSALPALESGYPILEAMHAMSLEEMLLNIREEDRAFMAGKEWTGVWTRDISYSILLSLALIDPETCKRSLLAKVSADGRVIQDTGTGGSWPISTDRMTWALAAWEVYKATGDQEWLTNAYTVLKKSTTHDLQTAFDEERALFRGESSFLDWRKQSYPLWMGPIDIYHSENLGTNAVHQRTYQIMGQMAELMGDEQAVETYKGLAQRVSDGINKHLWLPERQYYSQYLYGKHHLRASDRSESLGEALVVLFGIASAERARQVVANTPVTPYGVPSIYPQIPGIPPYHNNGIWPFVEAYYTWAGAAVHNEAAVLHGMGGIWRQAGLFLTNKENMVAENGDFKGTEVNSDRQLWSVAGNLAMVYRVLLGVKLSPTGLWFEPFVPEVLGGELHVSNFKYRNATLDITLKGHGHVVERVTVNGKKTDKAFLSSINFAEGQHTVVIELAGGAAPESSIALVANAFSPAPPAEGTKGNLLLNGEPLQALPSGEYKGELARYVSTGGWESFMTEPEIIASHTVQVEAEKDSRSCCHPLLGYTGHGVVELPGHSPYGKEVPFKVSVPESGEYLIDFRYSNGSGPINTDNKCALRSLTLNDEYVGPVVMPQLGFEEWSNFGYSNLLKATLEAGQTYTFVVEFQPHNANMNGEVNRALLDHMRLRKL